MNIVSPIEGYERGVCARKALLTRNENVATQPCEVAQRILPDLAWENSLVLYRLEVGAARAEGARSLWDDKDGFGTVPLDDI